MTQNSSKVVGRF